MAKVNINGMVFEGTNDELVELFAKLGAKIPAVEDAEETPKFEIGDYVKVVGQPDHYQHNTVVEIVGTDYCEDLPYNTRNLDGSPGDIHSENELVKATDEEVAEAKRQQAEKVVAAKWASINRKPNEFKKGDIVRGVRYNDTDDRFIGELEDENGDGYIGVRGGDGRYHAVRVGEATLITPVEARLDR